MANITSSCMLNNLTRKVFPLICLVMTMAILQKPGYSPPAPETNEWGLHRNIYIVTFLHIRRCQKPSGEGDLLSDARSLSHRYKQYMYIFQGPGDLIFQGPDDLTYQAASLTDTPCSYDRLSFVYDTGRPPVQLHICNKMCTAAPYY